MRHAIQIAASSALVLLAGCSTAPPVPVDPATQMPALEQRIAILIDEQRAKIDPKAKLLVIDSELTRVARERVGDMAAKNYFAHTAPDGKTSASLLMAEDARFQGLLGENMAALHYTKSAGIDVNAFAKNFVDGWLNSPPHRENLSFADYNRTGVGAALNGDTVYVTELFSTDLGLGLRDPYAPPPESVPMPNPKAAADAASKP